MDSAASVTAAERDCNALGGLFHIIINDIRGGASNWDDLLVKANKFHVQLKATILASTAFLDSFQKIADLATTTRSGTKEIGSALTRLCLRHRSVEAKLKSYSSSMLDSFILPLQDRVEEWKRIIAQLDKDHNKELKRLKQLKKKQQSADGRAASGFTNTTFRIKRNPRTKLKSDAAASRIGSMYDLNRLIESMESKEKYFMLEEVERNYVRRALIEERSHYCLFFNFLRPVVEEEISMIQEVSHLEEVLAALTELTSDPYQLPAASESLLTKLHLNHDLASIDLYGYGESHSPGSTLYRSRKSSISSIASITSFSTDSISLQNCKSLSQPNITPEFRPKSIASQDSGFISHDYNVPNVGRLTISKNRNSLHEATNFSNGKNIFRTTPTSLNADVTAKNGYRKSIATCKNYLDGEYASADQLYSSSLANIGNSNDEYSKQPIYENVDNNVALVSSSSSVGLAKNRNYSSDGSITPTNQANYSNDSNSYERENVFYQTSKSLSNYSTPISSEAAQNSNGNSNISGNRCKTAPKSSPPKPPTRHSSTLSIGARKPPIYAPPSVQSTRIYVVAPDSNLSPDFPPPPPEAYINYATPTSFTLPDSDHLETAKSSNSNSNNVHDHSDARSSCCNYSAPNRHLVLCNDINCLKDLQPYGHMTTKHRDSYGTSTNDLSQPTDNERKSFSFESSFSGSSVSDMVKDESSRRIIPLPPKGFSVIDRAKSVPNSRRYHSTINLAHQ